MPRHEPLVPAARTRRVAAAMIDCLALIAVLVAASLVADQISDERMTIGTAVSFSALVLLLGGLALGAWSARADGVQTIGQSAVGIRVVFIDGSSPARARAAARFLVSRCGWLLVTPWLIADVLFALVRQDRLPLHDLLCASRVVDARPRTDDAPPAAESGRPAEDPRPSPRRSSPSTSANASIAARLEQVERMHEAGALSDDEYERTRADIQRLICPSPSATPAHSAVIADDDHQD